MFDFLNGLFSKTTEELEKEITNEAGVKVVEVGTSGIENFSGYIQEDYFDRFLTPREFTLEYDKMVRKCDAVGRVLEVIKAPLKGATWEMSIKTKYSDDPKAEKQQELYQYLFFDDTPTPRGKFLNEVLSVFEYGFAVFEETYKIVKTHPEYGPHIGLKSFKWLNPKTIERWNLDPLTEELISIDQYAFGDAGRVTTIPAEWITHLSINRKGQDFNGISILRNLYGPYIRKENAEKKKAIGIDRFALGVLLAKVPNYQSMTDEEKEVLKTTVENYVAGAKAAVIAPGEGLELELAKVDFDPEKVQKSVDAESTAMMKRVLAGFQELGGSKGGAFALSKDLSDIFLGSLQSYARDLCGYINEGCLKRLHEFNSSDPLMVELTCRGVTDRLGKDFADMLKTLSDSKVLTPDDTLEDNIRERAKLPARDETTAREGGSSESFSFSEVFTLSEKSDANKIIKEGNKKILELSEKEIPALFEAAIKEISAYHESKKDGVPTLSLQSRNFIDQVATLFEETHDDMMTLHRSNYRRRAGISLSEKMAEGKAKKILKNLAKAFVITHIGDCEKIAITSYLQKFAADPESKVTAIGFHIRKAGEKYLKSAASRAKAQNAVTSVSAQSTRDFAKEVNETDDQVVSYTWANPSPVAKVCQELNGQTLRADHPDFERYMPPLHHLCKTSIIINTEKTKYNPKPSDRLNITKKGLDSATLID